MAETITFTPAPKRAVGAAPPGVDESVTVRPRQRPVLVIDGIPVGPKGDTGPMGPVSLPNTPGALALRNPDLDGFYAKLAMIASARLKAQWYGDSISALWNVGGFSAPWLVTKLLSQHGTGADPSVLGTRYTDPGAMSAVPSTNTTAGTNSMVGTGGYCATLTAGQEITVSGVMDSIRVVYGTSATGGTINVYDGSSSGAVVATVSAAGATSYSNILEWTFASAAQRTVTVKVVGGTGTILEQLVPINGLLSGDAGVDMMVTAHSGWRTSHFTPTGYAGSATDGGDSTSHGLALTATFQPDLVINNLGYNDVDIATYEADQAAFNAAVLAASPTCSILTVVPYNGAGNVKDAQSMFAAAERNAALHPGQIQVISYAPTMGNVADGADPYDWSWDGAHPRGTGKSIQAAIVAAAITGDPIGTAIQHPEVVARNANIPWVGDVTGALTGHVNGTLNQTAGAAFTASRNATTADIGYRLTYAGSGAATFTIPAAVTAIWGFLAGADITILCTGAGLVTIAGTGGVTIVGTAVTAAANQRLTITYLSGTKILVTRAS